MNGDPISKIQLLEHIKTKYANCFEMYDSIKQKSNKVLMSKAYSASLYGMFMPLDMMNKYNSHKGKVVNDFQKCNFIYYFLDDELLLTVRNIDKGDLYYIFYFHCESGIDVVWYSCKRKEVNIVGHIEFIGKNKCFFLESYDYKKINAYKEYTFDDETNTITEIIFANDFLTNGKNYLKKNEFKKMGF